MSKPCDLLEKLVFIWTLKNTNIHSQLKCTFFFRMNINHGKFGTFLNAFWKIVFFYFAKKMFKFRQFPKFFRFLPKFLWFFLKFLRFIQKFSDSFWNFPGSSEISLFLSIQKSVSVLFQTHYKQSKRILKLSSVLWWISLIPMNLTCI